MTDAGAKVEASATGVAVAKGGDSLNGVFLLVSLPEARERGMPERLGLRPGEYGVGTMHRPANVDDAEQLDRWMTAFMRIARRLPVEVVVVEAVHEARDLVDGAAEQCHWVHARDGTSCTRPSGW